MHLPGAEAPPEMSPSLIGMREDPAELIMIMSLGRRESQGALLRGKAREAVPSGLARCARPGKLVLSGVVAVAVGWLRSASCRPCLPPLLLLLHLPPPWEMAVAVLACLLVRACL